MKKILFLNLLLLLSAFSLHAQTDASDFEFPDKDSVYTYVEEMPEPLFSIPDFLKKNMIYPKSASANGISGTIEAKFVVNTDGSISDITIVGNRIPHGEDLENEGIRLIKSFPKWKPGKKKGKVVKVYYKQRFTFLRTEYTGHIQEVVKSNEVALEVDKIASPSYNIERYISRKMRYPELAILNNIEGSVSVRFIVTETGAIDSVVAVGKKVGAGLEEEAIRIISKMPHWQPATLYESPVKSYYTQKVVFRINDKK